MRLLISHLILAWCLLNNFAKGRKLFPDIPDTGHDDPTPMIVSKSGFPSETHIVTTSDGYILEVHRIPHAPKNANSSAARPVVFLQHGLLSSSADWVLEGTEKGLGFLLAENGYDVWMGNYRGNSYSRNHLTLDPDEYDFWRFSWDQLGSIDLPEMLEYVMSHTQQEEILYVGHSMGTTTFMVMANTRPEIMKHIKLANLLAPIAYVSHMISPLRLIAPFGNKIRETIDTLHMGGEFLPSDYFIDYFASEACQNGDLLQPFCKNIFFVLSGFDEDQMNATLLDTITHHTPAGASTYTFLHYGQEVSSGGFHAFDYGKKVNLEKYGTKEPPAYDLGKVTCPTAVYYADNDWLAQPEDVLKTITELPNLSTVYEVPYAKFNHLDFMYAMNARYVVYEELLRQLAKALQ